MGFNNGNYGHGNAPAENNFVPFAGRATAIN